MYVYTCVQRIRYNELCMYISFYLVHHCKLLLVLFVCLLLQCKLSRVLIKVEVESYEGLISHELKSKGQHCKYNNNKILYF